MTIDLGLKIENWKNKLLDLGKRNRLLNFKDNRNNTLTLQQPSIFELWEMFVINCKSIVFPYESEEIFPLEFDNEMVMEPHKNVVTNLSIKEQQRVLRNLRDKSKMFIEEQGINILYLSFGFLRYNDIEYSKQFFLAPLVLVPVTIKLDSIREPFELNLHEDEIIINPTLAYKLDKEYGIKIPEFNIDENEDLEAYLEKLENVVVTKNREWQILKEVKLGLFSFMKINMYKDLDMHKSDIMKSPLVGLIAGNSTNQNIDFNEINNIDHDKQNPKELFQVVDADSSQQDAIYCAKKGLSFVLQGPPGTGKSQTITNIIAECLAAGKKVLFVSEKMAALDVVHKRLAEAKLDDFCLIMHSQKASKRAILDQFEKSLFLASQNKAIKDEVYQSLNLLKDDRDSLNNYVKQIHEVIEPLHKSIYDVIGNLIKLINYQDVSFQQDNVIGVTQEKLYQYTLLLKKLSETIKNMSEDYHTNPWSGSNVTSYNFALQQDIQVNLSRIIPIIKQLLTKSNYIQQRFKFFFETSVDGIKYAQNVLNLSAQAYNVPENWILGIDVTPLEDEILSCKEQKEKFLLLKEKIYKIQQNIISHNKDLDIKFYDDLSKSEYVGLALSEANKVISNNQQYSTWNGLSNIELVKNHLHTLKEKIDEYNSLYTKISKEFEKEIFSINVNEMFFRMKENCGSGFRFFKPSYYKDRNTIRRLLKDVNANITNTSILDYLSDLRKIAEIKNELESNQDLETVFGNQYKSVSTNYESLYKEIYIYELLVELKRNLEELLTCVQYSENEEQLLKTHYESLYLGFDTDWDIVRKALDWSIEFKNQIKDINNNVDFIKDVCLCHNKENYRLYNDDLCVLLQSCDIEFSKFLTLFDDESIFKNMQFNLLINKLEECNKKISLLEEWVDFCCIKKECFHNGLGNYIQCIEEYNISSENIVEVFLKRFYRLWLDSVFQNSNFSEVLNFRRNLHENKIKEFKQLDVKQLHIARDVVRLKLLSSLPNLDRFIDSNDDVSILKRELGKQRRIMPIRKLFQKIADLILVLKPCLMMSPLTVSLFLESKAFKFDTVIFDEASQVCTENAIGAIFRGKQVIIAGDSKQLPPTNFFSSSINDGNEYDNDDDDMELYEYESLLEEAKLLPERTLLWHYRSKHEHLIAFSNYKIYKDRLITFPSTVDKSNDMGVEYVYVSDGYYDRGGRNGNVIEAERISELVFEHWKNHPERSLGVIAFGEIQKNAIDTAIRKKRMENPEFEAYFNEEKEEAFFIKSLENVQGDERDTIILSIGYAKDINGVMRMQFGPLGNVGGERRLNVAITRAKWNLKLVGSILPEDIDLERITTEGPKLLKAYIDFAIHGPEIFQKEITVSQTVVHDSPFEEDVYNFLKSKGYNVFTQVGCSGYRIDMAVKHPEHNDIFVLGIECDGATYHSARTARERDRLRQDVLENMGWKIHRIWSTDWLKNNQEEKNRLVVAIESSIQEYREYKFVNYKKDKENVEDYLIDEEKKEWDGFDDIPENNLNYCYYNAAETTLELKDFIMYLISNAYPIHYDFICKHVREFLKCTKITNDIRKQIDAILENYGGLIIKKGDFYYPKAYKSIIPHKAGSRSIDYISSDEIESGIINILSDSIGVTPKSLIKNTLKAFGFNRQGANISRTMESIYQEMLEKNKIYEHNGKVGIVKNK